MSQSVDEQVASVFTDEDRKRCYNFKLEHRFWHTLLDTGSLPQACKATGISIQSGEELIGLIPKQEAQQTRRELLGATVLDMLERYMGIQTLEKMDDEEDPALRLKLANAYKSLQSARAADLATRRTNIDKQIDHLEQNREVFEQVDKSVERINAGSTAIN